ncbi:MAG: winged helix-turn-helix transcriptional regulator [Candidatus Schekmanbacteria bacterium]|nr:winged helix-turn-helix transcriptional regulator [Candidatus Schekmanbacteria bacterium]
MDQTCSVQQLFDNLDTAFFRAMADPVRIRLLERLAHRPWADVAAIAAEMPQDTSVVSRHLAQMAEAGLLRRRKEGRHVLYAIDGETMLARLEALASLVRQCLALGCCA